jgi:uncharacterized phosphosugar-binding protein
MENTATKYLEAVRQILGHLEKTQLPAVDRAAGFIVDSLTNRGAVYCHSIGHGIEGDFINRAGGLAAVQPFTFSMNLNDPVPECLKSERGQAATDRDLEMVRLAVRTGNLKAGDSILVGSVSGRNRVPVELALACREKGVKVIGLTSMAYTSQITSLHPSGKKLFEVVDVAIDIGAPFGDAAVEVPGIRDKMLPVSGVGMAVAGWMIWGRVMERMSDQGKTPSVFISLNRPGSREYYDKNKAEWNQKGY